MWSSPDNLFSRNSDFSVAHRAFRGITLSDTVVYPDPSAKEFVVIPRNAGMRRYVCGAVSATAMLLSILVVGAPTRAAIIYDNGTPSLSGGFLSDDDSGVRFADDFTLAAPSVVNAVRFWGVYSPTNTPTAPDDFSIIFYGDGGGLPDGTNVIAAYSIGDPGRVDTGDVLVGGLTVFEYVATFSDLALGTAGAGVVAALSTRRRAV
jgi:hypothetical protein